MSAVSPKISIIIPLYNASKYIHRCISSIINQTFSKFEVIIIDDGSKDDSLAICKEYSKRDSRITVYSQSNQGAYLSRKKGLSFAKGDYILNIDADDWMENDMLEILYNTIIDQNADIVACGFYSSYPNKASKEWKYPYKYEQNENLLNIHMGYSALWNKLIKKEMFQFQSINSPNEKSITMWEDNLVTLPIRFLSEKTICINTPLYHYWSEDNDSICKRYKNKYPISEIIVLKHLESFFLKYPKDKRARRILSNLKVMAKDNIWRNKEIGGVKEWKNCFPISYIDILNSQLPLSSKFIRILFKFLPSRISQLIISEFKN